jgi:CRISPR-associated protein (TIGR02710 family)
MKKILILSVGGSADPVINAVKSSKADHIYFFCSSGPKGTVGTIDGPGDPCGDKRKSKCPKCAHEYYIGNPQGKAIAFQAALDKSQFDIITVDDPDDLNDCYVALLKLAEKIETIHGRDCQVIANYTGGTKTMSAAMAFVGLLTEKWDLSINVGPRIDLIKVRSGDVPVSIHKWQIFCQTQIGPVRRLIHDFDYAHAAFVMTEMLQHPLEKAFRDRLVEARQMCQSFDYWDKFVHDKALEILEHFGDRFPKLVIALRKISGRLKSSSGYERVGDLLNNAARKAHRGYYDDAVGRLYRATELFAQIRLETKHNQHSDNIQLSDLPPRLQKKYESRVRGNNKLILALKEDYELLSGLDDPVGRLYDKEKKKILSALKSRNDSISAHGLKPLDDVDYRVVRETLAGFLENASKVIGVDHTIPQLPQEAVL